MSSTDALVHFSILAPNGGMDGKVLRKYVSLPNETAPLMNTIGAPQSCRAMSELACAPPDSGQGNVSCARPLSRSNRDKKFHPFSGQDCRS